MIKYSFYLILFKNFLKILTEKNLNLIIIKEI